jgi:hypothetical protein
MNRVQLSRVRSVAGFATGIALAVYTAIVRSGDLFVTVAVGPAGATEPTAVICGDDGKIKTFKDIDDFVKQAAKLSAFNVTGVNMSFQNLEALDPKPFSGDYVTKARSTIVSYNENATKLRAVSADLTAQIALMPSTTAAEIALKAEKTAQKTAVDGQISWLMSEVARITALLPVA